MVHMYDALEITARVLDFYYNAWQSVASTRQVFERIGLGLTQAS